MLTEIIIGAGGMLAGSATLALARAGKEKVEERREDPVEFKAHFGPPRERDPISEEDGWTRLW